MLLLGWGSRLGLGLGSGLELRLRLTSFSLLVLFFPKTGNSLSIFLFSFVVISFYFVELSTQGFNLFLLFDDKFLIFGN